MTILVTGAKGFVGKNLCAQLKNIRDGKARNYGVEVNEIFEYDLDSTPEQLDAWCQDCTFVFNLAGVNRPQDPKEFMEGNFGFATALLNMRRGDHYRVYIPYQLGYGSSDNSSIPGGSTLIFDLRLVDFW